MNLQLNLLKKTQTTLVEKKLFRYLFSSTEHGDICYITVQYEGVKYLDMMKCSGKNLTLSKNLENKIQSLPSLLCQESSIMSKESAFLVMCQQRKSFNYCYRNTTFTIASVYKPKDLMANDKLRM